MRVDWKVMVGMPDPPSKTWKESDAAESIICVCGKKNGEVEEPVMVRSTGYPRLDERAIELMRKNIHWAGPDGCKGYRMHFYIKPASSAEKPVRVASDSRLHR